MLGVNQRATQWPSAAFVIDKCRLRLHFALLRRCDAESLSEMLPASSGEQWSPDGNYRQQAEIRNSAADLPRAPSPSPGRRIDPMSAF